MARLSLAKAMAFIHKTNGIYLSVFVERLRMRCLPLVPDGNDQRSFPVISIERNVPAFPEINQPLPVFRCHLAYRTTRLRVVGQNLHSTTDGFNGVLCGVLIPLRQKPIEPLHILQGCRSPDQT